MNSKAQIASLTNTITYQKDGQEITVPKNTLILIDVGRDTALIGDDHVYLESDEYFILST